MRDHERHPDEPPIPSKSLLSRLKVVVGPVTTDNVPEPIRFNRVHIIVNPAAGRDAAGLNLSVLNRVLNSLDIDWEMSVTRQGGDARQRAEEAVAAGFDAVAVYGGDGTILEVARGLFESSVPMILLPGGTGNVIAAELGIPTDLTQAAMLMGGTPNVIQPVDMGLLTAGYDGRDADGLFFHLGIGAEARIHDVADREAKDRAGMLAYIIATLRTFTNPPIAHYRLTLDGELIEVDAINCIVTTFGSVGVGGLTLSHEIEVDDGMLDVIIMENTSVSSVLQAATSVVVSRQLSGGLTHWRARSIRVTTDPSQPLVVDGEPIDLDEVTVEVVPDAVQVVVPAAA